MLTSPDGTGTTGGPELLDGFSDNTEIERSRRNGQLALLVEPVNTSSEFELLEVAVIAPNAGLVDERNAQDLFGYVHSAALEAAERVRQKRRAVARQKRFRAIGMMIGAGLALPGLFYLLAMVMNLRGSMSWQLSPEEAQISPGIPGIGGLDLNSRGPAGRQVVEPSSKKVAREQAAHEQIARQKGVREQTAQEQTVRPQPARKQAKERAVHEQLALGQPAMAKTPEQPAKEQATRDQAVRTSPEQLPTSREAPALSPEEVGAVGKKLSLHRSARWISRDNAYGFYVGSMFNAEYYQEEGVLTVNSERNGQDVKCRFSSSKPQPVSESCEAVFAELSNYLMR